MPKRSHPKQSNAHSTGKGSDELRSQADSDSSTVSQTSSSKQVEGRKDPQPSKGRPTEIKFFSTNGIAAFYYHLFPRQIRRRSMTLRATFGLGFATLAALAIAGISGILLMFYYIPSIERAHGSVQDIISIVPFGNLLRNLHRYSAHASVILCILHLARTLLWGAYRGTHSRVWLVGVGLLIVTLLTAFSGYLLPWDQDAYWTVTVGTSLIGYIPGVGETLKSLLLGGIAVDQPTLIRFYMFHVMALPAFGMLLLVLHFFRLRRAGGLARPNHLQSDPADELIPMGAKAASRHLFVFSLICLVCLVVAQHWAVRLGPPADLLRPDNPPKAPWFFVGFQEVVSYSALMGGFIFPFITLSVLFLCPWIDGNKATDGRFVSGFFARIVILLAMIIPAGTTIASILWWGDAPSGTSSLLNPATFALGAVMVAPLFAFSLGRRSVAVQALVTGLLTALVIFTLVGWFFRGTDWRLYYHPGPGHESDSGIMLSPDAEPR